MLVPMALGGTELLIVVVITVVLVFGASRIPNLAKALGRAQGEYQKGKVESEIELQKLRNSQASSESAEHDKLLNAAWQLVISTEGKTDAEIREDVKKALG